jgi:hypothetical protein
VRREALSTRTAIARGFGAKNEADRKAMNRVVAAARTEFLRFERTTLRSFGREATAWRVAVVRELKIRGLPLPSWLDQVG